MESHDEERLMYKNLNFGNASNPDHNCKDLLIALSRMEQAATFLFTIPGPKMIWQFGELGYDYSINFGCRVCAKPIRWDYFENTNRFRLYSVYAALANLKTAYDVFGTNDFTLSVTGPLKRINLNDGDMNVTVLGNFQVTAGGVMPNFQHAGWWYEYFTGDSINVITTTAEIDLAPGEYRLYTDVRLASPEIPASAFDAIATKENGITIYPNPAADHVHIEIENIYTTDAILEVYDLKGTKLFVSSDVTQQNGVTGFYLDITESGLFPGMYITKITALGKTYIAKMVVG
ncbi:MAG: T9SS type A sorting domain-containing protein, partial [Chitinophagales bacterium]